MLCKGTAQGVYTPLSSNSDARQAMRKNNAPSVAAIGALTLSTPEGGGGQLALCQKLCLKVAVSAPYCIALRHTEQ
jgi:hypothetical protein